MRNQVYFLEDDDSGNPASAGSSITNGVHYISLTCTGIAFSFWIDGVLAISNHSLSTIGQKTLVNGWVGAYLGPNTYYFGGKMYENIVYNSSLSDSDRQKIETYIKNRYAL